MMKQEIGIRELKNQASSIVRQVREESAEYIITHHGRPVAILRPIHKDDVEDLEKQKAVESWQKLLEIGSALAQSEPAARLAVSTLSQIREEENQWPS
jgi:prevent-host-death family protein